MHPFIIYHTSQNDLRYGYECTPLYKINDARRLFIILSRFFPLLLFFPIKTVCHHCFKGAGRLFCVSFISFRGVLILAFKNTQPYHDRYPTLVNFYQCRFVQALWIQSTSCSYRNEVCALSSLECEIDLRMEAHVVDDYHMLGCRHKVPIHKMVQPPKMLIPTLPNNGNNGQPGR